MIWGQYFLTRQYFIVFRQLNVPSLPHLSILFSRFLISKNKLVDSYLISAKRPDQVIVYYNNRTCRIMYFAVPSHHRVRLKKAIRDRYVDLARELKTMEHESDGDANHNRSKWKNPKRIGKGTGGLEKKSGDYPDYNITNFGQNAQKSPGDLKRLAITPTPTRNHQLKLVWKNLSRFNNNNTVDKEELEHLEKRKLTSTRKKQKQTPSNNRKWKKKIKKDYVK